MDLTVSRLRNQHISGTLFSRPEDVVRWFGAVQGQEYLNALWAVGLRTERGTEREVEQAIADKSIVRTWFMRGTLHFVPGEDIRWMLALMGPRMRKLINNVLNYNKLELDEALFARSNSILVKALEDGPTTLTRPELAAALQSEGIPAGGLRLSLMLQRAQADSLICYGTRRGKQVTFALLDRWVPAQKGGPKTRDEALARFAERYFTAHGPATLHDFVWWSGLTVGEAKEGLRSAAHTLLHEDRDGQTYWFSRHTPIPGEAAAHEPGAAYLLPNYDEYIVGYKDRSAMLDAGLAQKLHLRRDILFSPTIVVGGRVVGTWQRAISKNSVVVSATTFAPAGEAEAAALAAAADCYGRFLGLPVTLHR